MGLARCRPLELRAEVHRVPVARFLGLALDRAALRAAVVAGGRGGWWAADLTVDLRRGLGH